MRDEDMRGRKEGCIRGVLYYLYRDMVERVDRLATLNELLLTE